MNDTVRLLSRARNLLQCGHTSTGDARSRNGCFCNPLSTTAVRFSIHGALTRANHELGTTISYFAINECIFGLSKTFSDRRIGLPCGDPLDYLNYNEDLYTILEIFDLTIKRKSK